MGDPHIYPVKWLLGPSASVCVQASHTGKFNIDGIWPICDTVKCTLCALIEHLISRKQYRVNSMPCCTLRDRLSTVIRTIGVFLLLREVSCHLRMMEEMMQAKVLIEVFYGYLETTYRGVL